MTIVLTRTEVGNASSELFVKSALMYSRSSLLSRTVNLDGAPVTQESWCQCKDL